MMGRQINLRPDIAAHVDTGRTRRNMESLTDPQVFTSAGQWINKPTAPVSARRDGTEATILRTRTRTLRRSPGGHVGISDAEPYAPCKDHRWGGRRKHVIRARTKSGSTSEKRSACAARNSPWVARPVKTVLVIQVRRMPLAVQAGQSNSLSALWAAPRGRVRGKPDDPDPVALEGPMRLGARHCL